MQATFLVVCLLVFLRPSIAIPASYDTSILNSFELPSLRKAHQARSEVINYGDASGSLDHKKILREDNADKIVESEVSKKQETYEVGRQHASSSYANARKKDQMSDITMLRARLQTLNQHILHNHQEKAKAVEGFYKSLERRNSIAAVTRDIAQKRRALEQDLFDTRTKLSEYDNALRLLGRRAQAARLSINHLEDRGKYILLERKHITEDFSNHGFQHWVNNSLRSSVNPYIHGAVVHGTVKFVEPVLDSIERLADVNEHLTSQMSARLRTRVPLVDKPFYGGFVTYVVLLAPLVLAVSAILRLRRGVTKVSTRYLVVLANSYFGLLSMGCFAATAFVSVDVFATLRRSHAWIFQILVTMHVFLYLLHFSMHLTIALQSRQQIVILHAIIVLGIGLHVVLHVLHHSSRGETSHVDSTTYLMYTTCFAFILYQIARHHIQFTSVETGRSCSKELKSAGLEDSYVTIDILSYKTPNEKNGQVLDRPPDLDYRVELLNDHEGNTSDFASCSSPTTNVRPLSISKIETSNPTSKALEADVAVVKEL